MLLSAGSPVTFISQVELREQVSQLESQCSDKERQVSKSTELSKLKYQEEIACYQEQIRQHSVTICAMEERLNKVLKKNKDHQAEITQLNSTIQGKVNKDHQAKVTQLNSTIQGKVNKDHQAEVTQLNSTIQGKVNKDHQAKVTQLNSTIQGKVNKDHQAEVTQLNSTIQGRVNKDHQAEVTQLNSTIQGRVNTNHRAEITQLKSVKSYESPIKIFKVVKNQSF